MYCTVMTEMVKMTPTQYQNHFMITLSEPLSVMALIYCQIHFWVYVLQSVIGSDTLVRYV